MIKNKSLLFGVLLALLNAFALAGMSLCAKKLSAYFGPSEIIFFRNGLAVVVLFLWFVLARKLFWLKTERPFVHLFRGVIGTTGLVLGVWALSLLPLAETTVLLFTSPLFTVLLSYPVLKEKIGFYRMIAAFAGFMGVVIVVNPWNDMAALPLLGVMVGLGWGFSSGLVDIWLRLMGRTENANTTTFYFVLFGALVTALHWPLAEVQPGGFSLPVLWLLLGLGTTGLLSQLAKTHSYRLGEAAIIAPMMYTMIIWSMVFDYLFWGRMPAWNMIAGAALIVVSNILILWREKPLGKRQVLEG